MIILDNKSKQTDYVFKKLSSCHMIMNITSKFIDDNY